MQQKTPAQPKEYFVHVAECIFIIHFEYDIILIDNVITQSYNSIIN